MPTPAPCQGGRDHAGGTGRRGGYHHLSPSASPSATAFSLCQRRRWADRLVGRVSPSRGEIEDRDQPHLVEELLERHPVERADVGIDPKAERAGAAIHLAEDALSQADDVMHPRPASLLEIAAADEQRDALGRRECRHQFGNLVGAATRNSIRMVFPSDCLRRPATTSSISKTALA